MATTKIKTYGPGQPHFDDFDETKGFYRVLYRVYHGSGAWSHGEQAPKPRKYSSGTTG